MLCRQTELPEVKRFAIGHHSPRSHPVGRHALDGQEDVVAFRPKHRGIDHAADVDGEDVRAVRQVPHVNIALFVRDRYAQCARVVRRERDGASIFVEINDIIRVPVEGALGLVFVLVMFALVILNHIHDCVELFVSVMLAVECLAAASTIMLRSRRAIIRFAPLALGESLAGQKEQTASVPFGRVRPDDVKPIPVVTDAGIGDANGFRATLMVLATLVLGATAIRDAADVEAMGAEQHGNQTDHGSAGANRHGRAAAQAVGRGEAAGLGRRRRTARVDDTCLSA
mmetsp:Transcript_29952/g.90675  ORF Transcript_29952/g.90675 Transcript_29952/m.90675 type:complete len:284 (+) Transcript_29952:765-1616(+)